MVFTSAVEPAPDPQAEARSPVQGEVTFEPLGRLFLGPAHAVAVEGERAYLLANNGLTIADVSDPANPRKLGEWHLPLEPPNRTNFYLAVAQGRVYLPATGSKVYILDASDPAEPRVLAVAQTRSLIPEAVEVRGHLLFLTTLAGFLQVFERSPDRGCE
jgi:hypothetical protein